MRSLWLLGFVAVMGTPAWGDGSDLAHDEVKLLQGEWVVVGMEDDGIKAPADQLKGMKWVVQDTTITATDPDGSTGRMRFVLNSKTTPKAIDILPQDGRTKGVKQVGIYDLRKGRLQICYREPNAADKDRPKDFAASPNSGFGMILLEKRLK